MGWKCFTDLLILTPSGVTPACLGVTTQSAGGGMCGQALAMQTRVQQQACCQGRQLSSLALLLPHLQPEPLLWQVL